MQRPHDKKTSTERLLAENEELRRRLEESEEVLRAINSGEVDALVVSTQEGEQIYTLQGAEHPYRVLVETMNEGAATLDADGTILYCNSYLSAMLEVSLEKLIGSRLDSYIAGADYPFFASCLQEPLDRCDKREISLVTGGGNRLTVLFSCCVNRSLGGEVRGVVLTDVTPLKEAQETIRRLNRLHAVLAATSHAIVQARDRDSFFKEVCRVAVQVGEFRLAWVGLLDEGSGGVKVAAASGAQGFLEESGASPDSGGAGALALPTKSPHICNDLLESGNSSTLKERAREYGVRASASVAIRENGEVIGALTLYAAQSDYFDVLQMELLEQIGSDVTFALANLRQSLLRHQAEEALREETVERLKTVEELRRNEELLIQQNRLAALGEMIGNIAHQWRQPLNSLGLLIQQIPLLYSNGEVTQEFLDQNSEKSMAVIQHMSRTIDDFRTFFRPDAEKTLFSVREEVAKTLSLVAESFRADHIGVEVAAQADPTVRGYCNQFSQALLNILINARDALVERKIAAPTISLTIAEEKGRAIVTVTDNAGGISHEVIGRIFDPYFTTKGPQTGTGVGLYMSKAIVEKNMGGILSVRNVEGGAEFRIEL